MTKKKPESGKGSGRVEAQRRLYEILMDPDKRSDGYTTAPLVEALPGRQGGTNEVTAPESFGTGELGRRGKLEPQDLRDKVSLAGEEDKTNS